MAKREASFYLENVGKGKKMAAIEERKEKKRKREEKVSKIQDKI